MIIYTALITPFKEDDTLDELGFIELINEQKNANIDALIILGTTAETLTLSCEEKTRLIELAIEHKGNLLISVGCGSSSTKQTLINIQQAATLGADSALVASPAYTKPTDAGLIQHFMSIADTSPIPIILYNHPPRTGVNLTCEMQCQLATHPNIIGVKEASGDLVQITDILMKRPKDYFVLAGDDLQIIPFLALGAEGIASVATNLIAPTIRKLVDTRSISLQKEIWPLLRLIFSESNPIGIKGALTLAQKPAGTPRLPLVPMSQQLESHLKPIIDKL